MVADMRRGKLEYVDSLPYGAADAANGKPGIKVNFGAGSQVTNLGFNSNPKKSKNRELLNPRVKEAFEYAIPRQQIVDVVFSGHAKPWANILSPASKAEGWLTFDLAPGQYAMFCFFPDPEQDNMPHALEGMIQEFTVT